MGAILAVGGVNGMVCKARAPRTESGHCMHWLDPAEKSARDGNDQAEHSPFQRAEASSSLLTGFAARNLLSPDSSISQHFHSFSTLLD